MAKPYAEVLEERMDAARVRTQERLFKEFVACKTDEDRAKVGAKMDVLTDLVNVFKKEIRSLS